MSIREIVINMMDGSPDYNKPMTLKMAAVDVRNIKAEYQANGEKAPSDLTVRAYYETWNDILREARDEK